MKAPFLSRLASASLAAAFTLGVLGCGTVRIPSPDGARVGPFFQPTNVYAAPQLPANIRRVAVMPVASSTNLTEDTLNRLDDVVMRSLNEVQRFECVPVSRDDCMQLARKRAVLSTDALPFDFFKRLASAYGADAVLLVDITNYAPYPPQTLSIRAKLARLDDQSLLWSIDQTFSAANPLVVNAARRHWYNTQPPGIRADMSENVLQSPSRFAEYAFTASFATLPPRRR